MVLLGSITSSEMRCNAMTTTLRITMSFFHISLRPALIQIAFSFERVVLYQNRWQSTEQRSRQHSRCCHHSCSYSQFYPIRTREFLFSRNTSGKCSKKPFRNTSGKIESATKILQFKLHFDILLTLRKTNANDRWQKETQLKSNAIIFSTSSSLTPRAYR